MKYDKPMMDTAVTWARMSSCKKRQVGAVIAMNDYIIATGYNGTVKGQDNTCECEQGNTKPGVIHAEINAIGRCALAGVATNNATMYVTLAPCVDCAKLIITAGISRVVYKEQSTTGIVGLALLGLAGVICERYK